VLSFLPEPAARVSAWLIPKRLGPEFAANERTRWAGLCLLSLLLLAAIHLACGLLRRRPLAAGAIAAAVPLVTGTVGATRYDLWPTALVAAALAALSPFMVFYSAEARAYGVLMALVAGSTLALLVETQMGVNAVRLGALFGGPVLLCAMLRARPPRLAWAALVPVFAALVFWQWSPAVRDFYKAIDDPAAEASYFEPLKQYLATLPDQRRIEIPFTRSHWENAEVAGIVPLARGWLRQLDTGRNPIFYKGPLNEVTYARWLSENAVRYVALPSAKPDMSTYKERALIERGLPYLKLRWSSRDWRVFEVSLPAPFVIARGHANITLEQLGSDRLLLRVTRPGQALVRVRWTPYWFAHGGCVERDGAWTRVTALREGFLELTTRFSPERVVDRGRRCDDAVMPG
jgi:hypothetical protein